MELRVERPNARTAILYVIGRFDASQTDQFKQVWLTSAALRYIVVDLSGTDFIDSLALAALVSGLKATRLRKGDLLIVQPSEAVRVIFELTRMDAAFRITPSVEEAMRLVKDIDGSPVVITLHPRLDATNATELRAALIGELDRGNTRIILDASATRFIDSTGMAALASGHKAAEQQAGVLAVAGLQGAAREVFEITRMDQVFPVYPTVEAAKIALA